MKASEIRDLSPEEMRNKVEELKKEMFNLRFQHGSGQLEKTHRLKSVRKDIARLYTILGEN